MTTLKNNLLPTITSMIRTDHTRIIVAFHQYEAGASPQTRQALVNTVCRALEVHARLEEEIFYPAMRRVVGDNAVLRKSVPEHDSMRRRIAELRKMEPLHQRYDETFMALMGAVLHHVADEETSLLPTAERVLKDRLGELGAQMAARRMQLVESHAGEPVVGEARAKPGKSALLAAGALLAGTYVVQRSFRRHA